MPYDPAGNEPQLAFFSKLWAKHIPSSQQRTFKRIGCFTNDIGPTLRVFSINTMFLFNSNDAVHDCTTDIKSPGDLVLEWLEEKLHDTRMNGMKAYLSGIYV
jgi:hypothetical protein